MTHVCLRRTHTQTRTVRARGEGAAGGREAGGTISEGPRGGGEREKTRERDREKTRERGRREEGRRKSRKTIFSFPSVDVGVGSWIVDGGGDFKDVTDMEEACTTSDTPILDVGTTDSQGT